MTTPTSRPTAWYRTFVRGVLVQQSALSVGGSAPKPGGPDMQCARDGRGRLTIPGTGLAGALVETAGRICPKLFEDLKRQQRPAAERYLNRISGKAPHPPTRGREDELLQSLVRFFPCHRAGEHPDQQKNPDTESRQGVGIRQATGATAVEQRALFDLETVPAGTRWDFLLDIDTLRATPRDDAGRATHPAKLEGLILLALLEWVAGRCWLGAAVARGTGWMRLDRIEALRLPTTDGAIEAWPNSTYGGRESLWTSLASVEGAIQAFGPEDVRVWANTAWNEFLPDGRPHLPELRLWYLTLDAELSAGPAANGYGWDSLSVGGHAAGYLDPPVDNLLTPCGVDAAAFRRGCSQDSPVVVTGGRAAPHSSVGLGTGDAPAPSGRAPAAAAEQPPAPAADGRVYPFLPGSGVRGPLRHAASRWHRIGRSNPDEIVDPNKLRSSRSSDDPVSQLFGLVDHSARLIICDAPLTSDQYRVACFQHHAEDEFTAGVFGSGKFDRTAVLEGTFAVRLVLEAKDGDELQRHVATLLPALRLAQLGHMPLGGGKWRGHGWIPWRFIRAELIQAGDPAPMAAWPVPDAASTQDQTAAATPGTTPPASAPPAFPSPDVFQILRGLLVAAVPTTRDEEVRS